MKTIFAVIGVLTVLFVLAMFAVCNDDEGSNSWARTPLASHYNDDGATIESWVGTAKDSGIGSSRMKMVVGNGKEPRPAGTGTSSLDARHGGRIGIPGSFTPASALPTRSSSAIVATTEPACDPIICSSELAPRTARMRWRKGVSSPIEVVNPRRTASAATRWPTPMSMATNAIAESVVRSASGGIDSHEDEGDCDWDGDCGGQEYDQNYGSRDDRNRNRNRDRGAFSPGPFRDSPVTICLPYACNSGGEQSGGNRNDRRDEPPPDERGYA